MRFYLGTHELYWLGRVDVPLMVSRRRLATRSSPRAIGPWVLDSGGFTELGKYGRWTIGPEQYAAEVVEFTERVGAPEWVAPQDWMCEPRMLRRTGLTIAEHQHHTVENFAKLQQLGCPAIPVLQGWSIDDYLACVEMYGRAGVTLTDYPVVGLGSVCRRQGTDEIGRIVGVLAQELGPDRLHGFGAKAGAIRRYGHLLASSDSLAWSFAGRKRGSCTHLRSRCANHLHWALKWRDWVISVQPPSHHQMSLITSSLYETAHQRAARNPQEDT